MMWNRNTAKMMATAGVAMLIAASGAAGQNKKESRWITTDGSHLGGGVGGVGGANVVVVQNDDDISIRMENGKLVSVEHNGKKVPLDRVKQEGGVLRIVDEDGKTVHEMTMSVPATPTPPGGVGAGRKTARVVVGEPLKLTKRSTEWKPAEATLDLVMPKAMIGIQMAQPDRSLAGHFGFAEGSATMVSGVYEGLPASEAGLSVYDIIVGVDGKESAGQQAIRDHLSDMEPGDKVRLTVIQKGQRREVTLKLQKYDQEKLSGAKLSAVVPQAETAELFAERGAPGTMWFKPGEGGQSFTFETMPGAAEGQWLGLLEQRVEGQPWTDEEGRRLLLDRVKELEVRPRMVVPMPAEPGAPGGIGGGRFNDLEKRMQRLEALLEKLVEQQERGGR